MQYPLGTHEHIDEVAKADDLQQMLGTRRGLGRDDADGVSGGA
nr:hypothetical protein [Tessaracoccus antarcticus]